MIVLVKYFKNNLENELDTFTNLQTRNVTDDESNTSSNSLLIQLASYNF